MLHILTIINYWRPFWLAVYRNKKRIVKEILIIICEEEISIQKYQDQIWIEKRSNKTYVYWN